MSRQILVWFMNSEHIDMGGPFEVRRFDPHFTVGETGSREVLGGQAGQNPGILTPGKHTFPSVMLLFLAVGRDAHRETQPGPGFQPSERVPSGTVLKLQ